MVWTKMACATSVAVALIGSMLLTPSSRAQVDNDPAARNILSLEDHRDSRGQYGPDGLRAVLAEQRLPS